MRLLDFYHAKIQERGYHEETAQLALCEVLQGIADARQNAEVRAPQGGFWRILQRTTPEKLPYIQGLYCYGGVGRGKTFMMDLFMQYLPDARKQRSHFHRFMLIIHQALHDHPETSDPLDVIVAEMAEKIDLLCLDEFFVSDITDAMLLARLLRALEEHRITLVTTSNIPPDELYRDGLQREHFLPAIDWIKNNLHVWAMAAGEDFRLRHIHSEQAYLFPDTAAQRQVLEEIACSILGCPQIQREGLFEAGSRSIPYLYRHQHAICFDFNVLCKGNYSQKDYITIARRFPLVALYGLRALGEDDEDAAKRFLLLIDEFYDRRVKLLISAEVPVEQIYSGHQHALAYQRLQSRLNEMQTAPYWQEAHLP